jgi:flavin-dependent dehydrogenase
MISASRSYDLVILGSGIAGLAGALAAHALGLQPVVLEKAATLGGGTVHSISSPLHQLCLARPRAYQQAAISDRTRSSTAVLARSISSRIISGEASRAIFRHW